MYKKGGKNIQWGQDSFFKNWCWENWTAVAKKKRNWTTLLNYTINEIQMD